MIEVIFDVFWAGLFLMIIYLVCRDIKKTALIWLASVGILVIIQSLGFYFLRN